VSQDECFLILGGAGLVGRQIAREIASKLSPRKIIVAALAKWEVDEALTELRTLFKDEPMEWVGSYGNIFVREEYAQEPRHTLLQSEQSREKLYGDLFGSIDKAYGTSQLVKLILEHRPDVIVDSINTATAISYQDVYTASVVAKREVDFMLRVVDESTPENVQQIGADMKYTFDVLMLSQALPQLVRHVQMLYRAMCDVNTRLYLKIGTTGTGGMGLNIPYTHSEDKPSVKLMTKTAVAFAHTGLLFLMARTPEGPIVKEIKPGAMIGYADVDNRDVSERGEPVYVFNSRVENLSHKLVLGEDPEEYRQVDTLNLPVVNTGENGIFTRGEFEAITAPRQMEFLTPEEIARDAVLEIRGSNTGLDVIAAADGAVMNPTYRAGYLRQQVLENMTRLEEIADTHSVALGQLGPPELSKLLWEAELLKIEYGTLQAVLEHEAAAISQTLYHRIEADEKMRCLMTSIGVPVLTPDGQQLIRGPRIRIPEIPGETEVVLTDQNVDTWAKKGWVDLRPDNFEVWKQRFKIMLNEREKQRGRGSAALTRQAYHFSDIRIGEVVGWIFNNEQDGYRIK
jgi:hypothetical protein